MAGHPSSGGAPKVRPRNHQEVARGVPLAVLSDKPVQALLLAERTEGWIRRVPLPTRRLASSERLGSRSLVERAPEECSRLTRASGACSGSVSTVKCSLLPVLALLFNSHSLFTISSAASRHHHSRFTSPTTTLAFPQTARSVSWPSPASSTIRLRTCRSSTGTRTTNGSVAPPRTVGLL